MKKIIQLLIFLCVCSDCNSQTFSYFFNGSATPNSVNADFPGDITSVKIVASAAPGINDSYKIYITNDTTAPAVTIAAGSVEQTLAAASVGLAKLNGKKLIIKNNSASLAEVILGSTTENLSTNPGGNGGGSGSPGGSTDPSIEPAPPIQDVVKALFPNQRSTTYGIVLDGASRTDYKGRKYVHLFFDQNGNSILSVPPTGISNVQYVVHLIYLVSVEDPNTISCHVKQTKGTFSDALIFYSTIDRNEVNPTNQSSKGMQWVHKEYLLNTSTSDIEFEIYRTLMGQNFASYSTLLNTYTIKMSKVYHGTFDIGLIDSKLQSPTFSLVPFNDTTVVSRNASGNRGIVTAMYTFYTSPIRLFTQKESDPDFKRYGRNFLEDHHWYERIYPCVGVSLSDKVFENLFIGLNLEFARGGSIFFGYHYARVNTFDARDANFEFGVTPYSQEQLTLHSDTKWQWQWQTRGDGAKFGWPSVGVNLDIRIIGKLLGGLGVEEGAN